MQVKTEEKILVEKPVNEALELAKELGLKRQVELLSYEQWRKDIPYSEVFVPKIREELIALMTEEEKKKQPLYRLGLAQIKVQDYQEKLPMSVLIRIKEAKQYGFDEFQVWRIEAKVDPVLVGVKYEGEEEVAQNYQWQDRALFEHLRRQALPAAPPQVWWTDVLVPNTQTYWTTTDIDHSGSTWFDGGSPEKVMRKVRPHFFELLRWA